MDTTCWVHASAILLLWSDFWTGSLLHTRTSVDFVQKRHTAPDVECSIFIAALLQFGVGHLHIMLMMFVISVQCCNSLYWLM